MELRASIRFVEPNDRNEQIYFYSSDITVFYISFTGIDPDSDDAKLISDHIWIDSRNDHRIGGAIASETNRDPRVMLDIAAVLGLSYLGFLAVWFWATRVRMRPRSSAPS